jgi:hypothetical protein
MAFLLAPAKKHISAITKHSLRRVIEFLTWIRIQGWWRIASELSWWGRWDGWDDEIPEKNEGDDGARFSAARLVLAVETEALGEAHDNHLSNGEEDEGSHRIRWWNIWVVFAVIVSAVGSVGRGLVVVRVI